MANTYSCNIVALDTYPSKDSLSDVVYNIHYSYVGTSSEEDSDGNAYSASVIGTIAIGEPDADSFTAFADLTEETVVGWAEAALDLDELKANVDGQITEKITPSQETKQVPW